MCGSAGPIRWGWRYNSYGPKHREVKLVHGVPIACKKHGPKYDNNPAEQMVDDLKDWYRHMNGLSPDKSAADLLRSLFVHEDSMDTHTYTRTATRAERAGLNLELPLEDRVQKMIMRATRWRRENRKKSCQPTN